MWLFENKNNNATIVYDARGIDSNTLSKALEVESLPVKDEDSTKVGILKVDILAKKVWWDYVDKIIPKSIYPVISKAEFKKRLTIAERIKIVNYDKYIVPSVDPVTSEIESEESVINKKELMSVIIDDFKDFKEIDLNDVSWVEDFTQIVVYCGLLTSERVKEILSL